MHTNVPGRPPINFSRFYEEFTSYYPDCELATKKWWVDHVQPDWVIFDCGANVGYYSILFGQLASLGKVYAFEPTSTVEMLEANLAENSLRNVEVHRLALGATSGARVDAIFRVWGRPPERQEYRFTTIDEFVDGQAISRLDAIKIDVDSFDFEVLKGAERTLVRFDPYVVVELNHALSERQQGVAQALGWLASIGYADARVLDNENYILKRSERVSANGARCLTLVF